MKFWVVGKDGLLGKEMVSYFSENKIPFVPSSHYEADILDSTALEEFIQKNKPSHIVNCAAYVDVDKAESTGKELAYQLNVEGPKNLTRLAKKHGIRLIHVGTDYVFDGNKGGDYVETDSTHPINIYGETKLLGEQEVVRYEKGLCIRTASLYGSGKEGIVSGLLDILKTNKECKHISDQISSPTFTKDLAEAIYQVRDESGIFHFTNKGDISRYGLLLHMFHLAKELNIEINCEKVIAVTQKEAKRPATRPLRSVLCIKKIEPFLKMPIRTWESALREYITTLC